LYNYIISIFFNINLYIIFFQFLKYKLDSGNRKINSSQNSSTSSIIRAIKELEPLAKKRKVNIISKFPDEDIYTQFEKKGLHDALSNILMNGIKYTPSEGEIIIKLKREKDNLILTFSNTGIGLTHKEKKIIFTKFGKIEHYGEGYDIITEGSGLGLGAFYC